MASLLTRLAIICLFPVALKVFFYFVNRRGNPTTSTWRIKRREAFQTRDLGVYVLIGATALWCLYSSFIQPPANVFYTLDVSIQAPQYQLRSRWNQYAATQRTQQGDAFWPTDRGFPSATDKVAQDFDKYSYARLTPYGRTDTLVDRLQSSENRRSYANFGEQAFLDCGWCQSPADFAFYIIPSIFLQYLWLATVIVIYAACDSTYSPRRSNWRSYLLSFITVVFLVDLYLFLSDPAKRMDIWSIFADLSASPSASATEAQRNQEKYWFWYNTSQTLRACLFLLLSAALVLLDFIQGGELTDHESLQATMAQGELALQRLQALQLQRSAVARNSDLRSQVAAFQAGEETQWKNILKDSAFKEAYEKAARKPNHNAIVAEAQGFVNAALDVAFAANDQSDKKSQ
ncbi:hypothetical protein H4R33_004589 [Dimargaris cristalligena]|uniref:Uncharacterized protein n=1 Tax=Dimargaris cristalligena TaxID=215637 RepID=A0A4P9ZVC7_9FUNG|nr:hypothetical protein H4R33_004589 [Dimargaris cristalligena]RKP37535.1 hypothetical protein BJ085DRAFT_37642 [Dimargaris cristalligena]|eukprot:RKP37535.1 hypothetical protein BJ085DRAFT_37642 [Dimargaris cristalligena]